MSEAGLIQIVTLILAAVAPIALVWVKVRLDGIKHELNSRLDEWKKEALAATEVAVEAALARGKLVGQAEPKKDEAPVNMAVENMQVETLNVPKK